MSNKSKDDVSPREVVQDEYDNPRDTGTCEHCAAGIPLSADGLRHDSDLGVWACQGAKRALASNDVTPTYVFCCGADELCERGCECQCHSLVSTVERLTRELAEYKARAEAAEIAQVESSKRYGSPAVLEAERDRLRAALVKLTSESYAEMVSRCDPALQPPEPGSSEVFAPV